MLITNTASVPASQSFRDWCLDPKRRLRRTDSNCYAADFISEVRADNTFPQTATEWGEIRDYLNSMHADPGAYDAGEHAFRQYRKSIRALSTRPATGSPPH